MKKYIQPTIMSMSYSCESLALVVSDTPGNGDGMTNEDTFEEENDMPTSNSVWG
ncbi:MAG: hypothetical protein IKX33_06380 [Prevotella sp.]|nr:hypothetical protein [Prevotella sp.]